jgi:hypothetical protein
MLLHIDEADGREFAAWIANGYGDLAIEQLQGLGKEAILLALQGYPPLWQRLQGYGARVGEFVDEFLQGPADDDDEPEAQQGAEAEKAAA